MNSFGQYWGRFEWDKQEKEACGVGESFIQHRQMARIRYLRRAFRGPGGLKRENLHTLCGGRQTVQNQILGELPFTFKKVESDRIR